MIKVDIIHISLLVASRLLGIERRTVHSKVRVPFFFSFLQSPTSSPTPFSSFNTKADRKTGPPSTVYTTEIPIRYSVTSDLTVRSASSNLHLANERMNSAEG